MFKFSFKRLFKISFFIILLNSFFFSFYLLEDKFTTKWLTESQKLSWYTHIYNWNDLRWFDNYTIKKEKLSKICKDTGFKITPSNIHFCNKLSKYTFILNEDWKTTSEKIQENYPFFLLGFFLVLIYLRALSPRILTTSKEFIQKNITTDLGDKIESYIPITKENLFQLEDYVNNILKEDTDQYFELQRDLHLLEGLSYEKWMKDTSTKIKIISEKLKWKYYRYTGNYLGWFWNIFSYLSSVYLTNLLVFFFFLLLFIFFNSIIFREVFFITSNWVFSQESFWYIYETINITSNLWWNTEWEGLVQQIFLSYLTISWVVIFWLLLAIVSERLKTK